MPRQLETYTPRSALWQYLQQQPMQVQGGSGYEALANVGTQMLRALMAKKLMQQEERELKADQTKQQAGLAALLGQPPSPEFTGPMPAPASQQALAQALMNDPTRAPQYVEMFNAMKPEKQQMSPQALLQADINAGRVTPAQLAAQNAATRTPQEGPKLGAIREFQRGDKRITQQWDGKQWSDMAEGPQWSPEKGRPRVMYDPDTNLPVSVEEDDPAAAGLLPKPSRVVASGDAKTLQTAGANLDTYERLGSTFKDEFVGAPVLGGIETALGKVGGEKIGISDKGQAEWWGDYQTMVNAVRNDLFGAALTPGEKDEFEKQMITQGMDPALARQNLARQTAILKTAAARQGRGLATQGYSKKAIETYLGRELDALPDPMKAPAAAVAAPKRLKFNPATGQLE